MRRLDSSLFLAGAAVILLVFVAIRHRPVGVTSARLEEAFAPTFGNLVQLQRSRLKLPEIDRAVLKATAQCQKLAATAGDSRGAGDSTCTVLWSSDGSEAHMGGPTLTPPDGTTLANSLHRFEGCFDTSGRFTGKD